MTWDPNSPKNSTKIRNSPSIFQSNWQAIENGDVPCEKWTLEQRASNPGTPSDPSGLIYTKPNDSSDSELWFKNENGDSTRITRRGGLGDFAQAIYVDDIVTKPAGTEIINNQDAFVTAWGQVDKDGNMINGYGVSSTTRTSEGHYTVNLLYTFAGANDYAVTATPYTETSENHNRTIMITAQRVDNFRVRTTATSSSSGDSVDVGFNFSLFGGLMP
jgi:hypothetical protein